MSSQKKNRAIPDSPGFSCRSSGSVLVDPLSLCGPRPQQQFKPLLSDIMKRQT